MPCSFSNLSDIAFASSASRIITGTIWVQDFSICVDRLEDTWESFSTFLNLRTGSSIKEEAEGDERWVKKEVQETDLVNPQLMREAMQSSNLISFGQGATLPGDSLLFVAGIYCAPLAAEIYASNNQWISLFILFIFISAAGILGNYV